MSPLTRSQSWAAALLAAAAALAGTLVLSDDPDMFHHLALGREILRSGLFEDERFLYPILGDRNGPPPYWLGSVAIYGWHRVLGDAGLSLLPAVLGALLCVVLLLDAAPRAGRHTPLTLAAAALPLALALETFRYRAVARTDVFAAVLLAVTMWALRRFEDGRPRLLLATPLVAVLWTNLHPSTAIALVPVAVLFAARGARLLRELARRRPPPPGAPRDLALLGGVLGGVVLASLVTPSPLNPVAFALRFATAALARGAGADAAVAGSDASIRNVTATVLEMQGGGAALWASPVGVLIAVTAVAMAASWRTIRAREALTVAAFAVLPFAAVRFAMFFAIVAAPIAARHLGEAVSRRLAPRFLPWAAGAFALAAAATLPLGAQAPHIRFGAGPAWGLFPVRGADYLAAIAFEGRLFNTFQLGGYLEWREVGPPFQDGRAGLRPEDAAAALTGPANPLLFAELDARYRFDALLVTYPAVTVAQAQALGAAALSPPAATWALVAFDDAALLYLRRDGRYAERARRDEFRHATPWTPAITVPARELPALLADFRRAVVEAPGCVRCRFFQGQLALALGLPAEAAAAVAPAIPAAVGPERAALTSIAERASVAVRR